MPTGIQIINTHGSVLISDQSPCMQMRAKYNATISGSAFTNINVPNCINPLFALRVTTANKVAYVQWPSSGGTRTVQLAQPLGTVGNIDVVLYHFDRPVAPTVNMGLQVYNAAGECMFDAMGKTAVVVGETTGVAGDVNAPSGKQYAFCTPALHRRFMRDHDGSTYYNHHFRNAGQSLSNGGVTLLPDYEVVFGEELSDLNDLTEDYLVATNMVAFDVTGY